MKTKSPKIKAYVIEPIDGEWHFLVAVTEYFENGRWMQGIVEIISLQDIVKRAWKEKVKIYPRSLMEEK